MYFLIHFPKYDSCLNFGKFYKSHQEKLCYEYNQRSINKICSFYKSIFALKQIKASTYAFLAQKYCTMQWPSGCMLAR